MVEHDSKFFLNDVHVGKRGQIVIPKRIRELFGIKAGDHLVLLGNGTKGMAILKPDRIREFAQALLNGANGAGKSRGQRKA